jgi:hypothetical protein
MATVLPAGTPTGTVLSEVGIAAQENAQYKPCQRKLSNVPLDPAMQAEWFTAACDADAADGDSVHGVAGSYTAIKDGFSRLGGNQPLIPGGASSTIG